MKYFTIIFLLVITISISGKKGSEIPKTVRAVKLDKPLKIDGILDEALYNRKPIDNFIQKEPEEGPPSSEKTHVWIAYDESNIYFSAMFYDVNPDSMDIRLMRRDNMTTSDWFWIYMDPYNDGLTGYYFAVNPGGSICDGTLYNDGWMDDSWDGIWGVETKVHPDGWSSEIKIPFSQLRFKESEEMVWGINLNRDIKRKHEMSFLVMIPHDESGFCSRMADLRGLDGIKPKQRFELLPYIVQKAQFLRDKENDPFYKSNQFDTRFGGDLKFSLGANFNVDATINPDFGQVEVDPAIVNLSAFENYFDEKRPFFIEGANVFDFGRGGANNNWGFNFGTPTYYYSRRIGRSPQGYAISDGYAEIPGETRILGAGKLTGQPDPTWTIGALSAVTERTFARVQNEAGEVFEDEVEPLTHYGVLRTQKKFNEGRQALGMIFTSVNRDLDDENMNNRLVSQAYTFGLDGWTFLDEDKIYVITGSVVGTHVSGSEEAMLRIQKKPYRYLQRPDKTFLPLDSSRTSLSGMYSRIMLNKQEGNVYLNAAIGAVSPGFEYNDLGFQSFADRINGHVITGYRWYESDGTFRRKSILVAFNNTTDYEGDRHRMGFYTTGSLQHDDFWGISLNSSINFESVSTTLTRGGPKVRRPANYSLNLSGYTDNRQPVVFEPYTGYWQNDDIDKEYYAGIEVEWKPAPHITVQIDPSYTFSSFNYQWVGAFDDDLAAQTYGRRYLFGKMDQKTFSTDFRVNWSFSPKLSLQIYAQALFSVGSFDDFKELAYSGSSEFNHYNDIAGAVYYDADNESYTIDPDGGGPAESLEFSNPDFNFKSLRGNMLLRWELLPGSVLYLVWTHDKMNFANPGRFRLNDDFSNLWSSSPNNIFLVKFSYWIDV